MLPESPSNNFGFLLAYCRCIVDYCVGQTPFEGGTSSFGISLSNFVVAEDECEAPISFGFVVQEHSRA